MILAAFEPNGRAESDASPPPIGHGRHESQRVVSTPPFAGAIHQRRGELLLALQELIETERRLQCQPGGHARASIQIHNRAADGLETGRRQSLIPAEPGTVARSQESLRDRCVIRQM